MRMPASLSPIALPNLTLPPHTNHHHTQQTFSNTLTQPLEALALEEEVQLVFFHPEWVFRDGVRASAFFLLDRWVVV